MRNFTIAIATLASTFALLHCAGGSPSGGPSDKPENNDTTTPAPKNDAGPAKPPPSGPADAGPKTVVDAGHDSATPPAKGQKDGGTTPPPEGPGPTCTALAACCGKLSNSFEQVGCLIASGKKNELVCGGAMVTFNCAAANNPSHGPSCLGLIPGFQYCGNDGPHGDPKTLYQCNNGNISIVRQCPSGCNINPGIDDSCSSTTGGGGGGGGGGGADCSGFSGMFCGGDQVGGNPDTLYNCSGDKVANSQVCANGCVTNSDPSLNDYCATTPPSGGGGGGGGVSCSGLPDFKYCGSDGVGGDPDTLYTCSGGSVAGSTVCSNGCTVGASNADDYCSGTSGGGGGGGGPDCTGLSDGTYCGSNGVMGDPDTVYTCSGGSVFDQSFCTYGCYSSTYGGSDSCN